MTTKIIKTPSLHKFFSYGLFLDTSRLAINKNTEEVLGVGFLPFHKVIFDSYATIVKTKSEKDLVWGILYKINDETLNSLDLVEGYPIYYDRTLKDICVSSGKEEAWVYHIKGELNFRPPQISYFNLIKNMCIKHKFPSQYIEYISNLYKETLLIEERRYKDG